jgi:hypothetical protein
VNETEQPSAKSHLTRQQGGEVGNKEAQKALGRGDRRANEVTSTTVTSRRLTRRKGSRAYAVLICDQEAHSRPFFDLLRFVVTSPVSPAERLLRLFVAYFASLLPS